MCLYIALKVHAHGVSIRCDYTKPNKRTLMPEMATASGQCSKVAMMHEHAGAPRPHAEIGTYGLLPSRARCFHGLLRHSLVECDEKDHSDAYWCVRSTD